MSDESAASDDDCVGWEWTSDGSTPPDWHRCSCNPLHDLNRTPGWVLVPVEPPEGSG